MRGLYYIYRLTLGKSLCARCRKAFGHSRVFKLFLYAGNVESANMSRWNAAHRKQLKSLVETLNVRTFQMLISLVKTLHYVRKFQMPNSFVKTLNVAIFQMQISLVETLKVRPFQMIPISLVTRLNVRTFHVLISLAVIWKAFSANVACWRSFPTLVCCWNALFLTLLTLWRRREFTKIDWEPIQFAVEVF